MKTAISIPDDVFEQAEAAAKRLGLSRSELFTRAVREFLGEAQDASVTDSYNAAFDDEPAPDAFHRRTAQRTLLSVEWSDE
jgi:Ribbon-helix-helix protein, copG family